MIGKRVEFFEITTRVSGIVEFSYLAQQESDAGYPVTILIVRKDCGELAHIVPRRIITIEKEERMVVIDIDDAGKGVVARGKGCDVEGCKRVATRFADKNFCEDHRPKQPLDFSITKSVDELVRDWADEHGFEVLGSGDTYLKEAETITRDSIIDRICEAAGLSEVDAKYMKEAK